MTKETVPFMLVPDKFISGLGRRGSRIGMLLLPAFPSLRTTLLKVRMDVEPDAFLTASLASSLIYGLFFSIVGFFALTIRPQGGDPLAFSLALGLTMTLMFFMLHAMYPSIVMKKIAVKENKDLLFALREIIIDVDGGVPHYDSLKNVSRSGYGYVSKDFESVVNQIESGVPERTALKELAIKTESEYLKRAAWQMVNALESGSRMSDALESIALAVESYLFSEIKNYSSNLNFLLLLYMLGGVVAPSLGITFMILLSAFSGLGVTMQSVLMLIGATSMLQVIMIGYMAATRPGLFGG